MAKNLGRVTAYAHAKAGGYTGTQDEFNAMLAGLDEYNEAAAQSAEEASGYAEEASGYVTEASGYADNASESASAALDILGRLQGSERARYWKHYDVTTQTTDFAFNPTNYSYTTGDDYDVYVNGEMLDRDKVMIHTTSYGGGYNVTIIIDGGISGAGNPDKVDIFCYKDITLSTDDTLTEQGAAADAKATGDAIDELRDDLSHISGMSDDVKETLLACFQHVAWIDEHGQNYYDALEEALYPQPVPEWDYEWYATSQTIPTDMTGVSEYDFTTEPGAIYILRSNAILDFNFIGDCEVEIEAKFNDYLGGSTAPQITVCMANDQTSGHYFGGVICANRGTNNPYISYNIDGTWYTTSYDQRQYHVYNIKAENGTVSVTIDGTLVATGSGRENTTSLFTRYWQPNYEPAFLKSIKFKRL